MLDSFEKILRQRGQDRVVITVSTFFLNLTFQYFGLSSTHVILHA